jgi:hypothetical protein
MVLERTLDILGELHCFCFKHFIYHFKSEHEGKGKVVPVLFFLTDSHAMGLWRYSSTHS